MLDDCAVVVSENIFRHRSLGKSPAEAAEVGAREVGMAVTATALTTIVVFLPVIYVHGVAGQLFRDTALTVTFSLLASLLVSLTLLPMLAEPRGLEGRRRSAGVVTEARPCRPASRLARDRWRLIDAVPGIGLKGPAAGFSRRPQLLLMAAEAPQPAVPAGPAGHRPDLQPRL